MRNSSRIAAVLLVPWLATPLCASDQNGAVGSITARDVRAHVSFLASDLLAGRDSGRPGGAIAARYIASQFERAGLSPLVDGWQMEFELRGGAGPGTAEIRAADQRYKGASLVDAPSCSAVGSVTARVATADQDDLAGFIVIVDGWESDNAARRRSEEFLDKGAKAVIFAVDSALLAASRRTGDFRRMSGGGFAPTGEDGVGPELTSLDELPDDIRDKVKERLGEMGLDETDVQVSSHEELLKPDAIVGPGTDGEVIVMAGGMPDDVDFTTMGFGGETRRLSAPIVRVAKPVADTLRTLVDHDETVKLRVTRTGRDSSTNVLAVLEGADPDLKDEFVVIGAHYDHVGVDSQGTVWNGADDNASGTSAVLEIGEAFARLPERPRRSVVLAAWGAEERGLVGSSAFGRAGPVSMDKVVAYVNLDMVGRNDPESIDLHAASETLRDWAYEAGEKHGLDPVDGADFFLNMSDSQVFVQHDVPTLFFCSGVHEDVHQPTDDADKLDADKAARVARTAFDVALRAANASEPPSFDEPSAFFDFGMLGGGGAGGGERKLGVYPKPGGPKGPGVLVSGIVPDSVAEAAGVEAGDRIARIGQTEIDRPNKIASAIRDLPVGEDFEIEVIRENADGDEEHVVLTGQYDE